MKTLSRFFFVSFAWLIPAVTFAAAANSMADERQPLRFVKTPLPIFPQRQLFDAVLNGDARIAISVDHTGRLTDSLAVAYSHRDFADAALAALEDWEFSPMRVGGEPVPCQVDLTFNFEARGVVVSIDASSVLNVILGDRLRGSAYAPCTFDELDRIPTPITTVRPHYPPELADRGIRGTAVIEFYIDESGRVRMPAVTRADFDELGFLGIEAVKQWTFAPPTRGGKPVITRVRQTMHFQPGDS